MDKPLSGQRIKVCGEVQNNREEPREGNRMGGMREPVITARAGAV
jgi:hypothetical protein